MFELNWASKARSTGWVLFTCHDSEVFSTVYRNHCTELWTHVPQQCFRCLPSKGAKISIVISPTILLGNHKGGDERFMLALHIYCMSRCSQQHQWYILAASLHYPCSGEEHNLYVGNLSAEVDSSELLVSVHHSRHIFTACQWHN